MNLRTYQQEAVAFLTSRRRGFLVAPAGSGKTVCGAAALLSMQPASFAWVANTKEQVQQAETALAAVGLDGMVCCMMARPELSSYDIVVVDESHHAPAAVWGSVIGSVRQDATLWGLSATPWGEDPDRNEFLKNVFINFAFIDREEVMAGGHLVPGVVRPVDLDTPMQYERELKPLIDAEVMRRCLRFRFVPEHEHRKRATWQLTLEHLQNNTARNAAIINIAKAEMEAGETVIVLVSSIAHGEGLAANIPGAEVLHSKLPAKLRRFRVEALREGTLLCAVATSLMDEGADFPIAGVIILASAGRSSTKTIQRTGRVMRPHAGKTEGVVYDFVDRGLIYAHAQWKARRRVYQELQYHVESNP